MVWRPIFNVVASQMTPKKCNWCPLLSLTPYLGQSLTCDGSYSVGFSGNFFLVEGGHFHLYSYTHRRHSHTLSSRLTLWHLYQLCFLSACINTAVIVVVEQHVADPQGGCGGDEGGDRPLHSWNKGSIHALHELFLFIMTPPRHSWVVI